MKQFLAVIFLIVATVACGNQARMRQADKTMILASTTSTQDSGLLDLLVPMFQEQTGYLVQTVAVGTGAALRMAEEGNADVLLVHAPSAEKELMANGYGKDRFLVMHNDFVLVGPPDDSAEVGSLQEAGAAFAAIAALQAPFVSRGDDSGTHKKELSIWQQAGFRPNAEQANWYLESGQGMGRTLFIASEKGAYAMTDRATYLAQRDNLDLVILLEGDADLLNIYHVITVNPSIRPNNNYDAALAFAEFMIATETQAAIGHFGVDTFGQPLFFPDGDSSESELGLP